MVELSNQKSATLSITQTIGTPTDILTIENKQSIIKRITCLSTTLPDACAPTCFGWRECAPDSHSRPSRRPHRARTWAALRASPSGPLAGSWTGHAACVPCGPDAGDTTETRGIRKIDVTKHNLWKIRERNTMDIYSSGCFYKHQYT